MRVQINNILSLHCLPVPDNMNATMGPAFNIVRFDTMGLRRTLVLEKPQNPSRITTIMKHSCLQYKSHIL